MPITFPVLTFRMAVFAATEPLTRAQMRRRWIAASLIVAAGLGFAVWAAIDCSHIVFGYVASYTYVAVLMLGCVFAVTGLLLMIYWRTRTTGLALFGTGIATYLVFLGCIGVLKKFDKVAWVHEPPMQAFGPDQQASLIIYYRPARPIGRSKTSWNTNSKAIPRMCTMVRTFLNSWPNIRRSFHLRRMVSTAAHSRSGPALTELPSTRSLQWCSLTRASHGSSATRPLMPFTCPKQNKLICRTLTRAGRAALRMTTRKN